MVERRPPTMATADLPRPTIRTVARRAPTMAAAARPSPAAEMQDIAEREPAPRPRTAEREPELRPRTAAPVAARPARARAVAPAAPVPTMVRVDRKAALPVRVAPLA